MAYNKLGAYWFDNYSNDELEGSQARDIFENIASYIF